MNISARRQDFESRRQRYEAQGLPMTDADWKRNMTSIRLSMGQVIEDDGVRRRVTGWLWGRDGMLSTSELSGSQLFVMKKWLQPLPVGEDWTINRVAKDEIYQIVLALELPPMVQAAVELGGVVTEEGDDPDWKGLDTATDAEKWQQEMDDLGKPEMVETAIGSVSKAVWDEHVKLLVDERGPKPKKPEYFTFD